MKTPFDSIVSMARATAAAFRKFSQKRGSAKRKRREAALFRKWYAVLSARAAGEKISFGPAFLKEIALCFRIGCRAETLNLKKLKAIERRGLTIREYLNKRNSTGSSLENEQNKNE